MYQVLSDLQIAMLETLPTASPNGLESSAHTRMLRGEGATVFRSFAFRSSRRAASLVGPAPSMVDWERLDIGVVKWRRAYSRSMSSMAVYSRLDNEFFGHSTEKEVRVSSGTKFAVKRVSLTGPSM